MVRLWLYFMSRCFYPRFLFKYYSTQDMYYMLQVLRMSHISSISRSVFLFLSCFFSLRLEWWLQFISTPLRPSSLLAPLPLGLLGRPVWAAHSGHTPAARDPGPAQTPTQAPRRPHPVRHGKKGPEKQSTKTQYMAENITDLLILPKPNPTVEVVIQPLCLITPWIILSCIQVVQSCMLVRSLVNIHFHTWHIMNLFMICLQFVSVHTLNVFLDGLKFICY